MCTLGNLQQRGTCKRGVLWEGVKEEVRRRRVCVPGAELRATGAQRAERVGGERAVCGERRRRREAGVRAVQRRAARLPDEAAARPRAL